MSSDSKDRYGSVSRVFHWGMALLIIWQFLKFFDRIGEGEHWVGETLVSWHVSIGSLLLLLIVLRMIWARKQKNNRPEYDPATVTLVKIGHGLMYAAMLLMPITGMLYVLGNGFSVTAFGVELISGSGTETGWMLSLGALHSPLAWLLLLMILGHIGIALMHHFVRKDDVLQRML